MGMVPSPRRSHDDHQQIIDTETVDGPTAIVHAPPEGGSPKRV